MVGALSSKAGSGTQSLAVHCEPAWSHMWQVLSEKDCVKAVALLFSPTASQP